MLIWPSADNATSPSPDFVFILRSRFITDAFGRAEFDGYTVM
jgi:hypothetical protein